MQINTSELENCFNSICALAKHEPMVAEKAGQINAVILSADHDRTLQVTPNITSLT